MRPRAWCSAPLASYCWSYPGGSHDQPRHPPALLESRYPGGRLPLPGVRAQLLPRVRHRARGPPPVRLVPQRAAPPRARRGPPATARRGVGRGRHPVRLDGVLRRGRRSHPHHRPHGADAVAKPLGDNVLSTCEDAVRLLREAPAATLICHPLGSVPLALGLLRYWTDVTNPRTPDSTCALEALALALLLVWMNTWRAVFAGGLRRQLAGTPAATWSPARIFRLAAGQAFLGATHLPAVGLAAFITFPLAGTVAFFRMASSIAGAEDLDPFAVIAKARRLSARHTGANWTLLPLLTFFWLIVTLNLAVTIGLAPQLVRVLTGYESAFSRSGFYFIQNPLFVLLVFAVSWIA